MILQHKNAIIYGGGGSLGGAVAKAFAAAGARVFLAGRHLEPLQAVADTILASGGKAVTDVVDALDETAIYQHIESVVQKAGSVDISFNLIDLQPVQGVPLIDMKTADFVRPVHIAMQTQFMTATAAARAMKQQGSGVILSLTATSGAIAYPLTGGFSAAECAIECFSKNLAAEVGIYGIRVANIRSGGSPDSKVFADAIKNYPEVMDKVLTGMKADTMLKRMPLMNDISQVAVFLASDMAGAITGVTVDATCGSTAGLNYRMAATGGDTPLPAGR
jgi:3-oxoacyl-[acyl-carrier protein] reductase